MDLILELADTYFFDAAYRKFVPLAAFPFEGSGFNATTTVESTLSAWPRSYMPRQILSLTILTLIGIHVLYFLFASLSYYLIFNHDMMLHPRFLPNQVKQEIQTSLKAFPVMTLLTLPWFLGEVRGWSKLYSNVDDFDLSFIGNFGGWGGWVYMAFSSVWFLVFTDYCIYWIHRWLHHPLVYKPLHKPHHKWIIPTPFASHAFHPVDGYLQSVPYHLYVVLFPMHRLLFLVLFVAVNFWAIFIHDSDMITGHPLENFINGPAHHTLHHIYFTVNYGQYFTWADRTGNSYRHPDATLDPLLEVKMQERAVKEGKTKLE
ncbi:fatty acid hydroxylase [Lentinula guzmanii]|uniref:Fatty acid hydroxylase n=2 Tax=Lentinula TaxID=5352 RepID=A0AA38JCM7_9AGAR|nr:fatty acid hydroxylase [Lentinula guzmanii]KAJ3740511.1 fatty acid hydroxylase [Lentinula detonsa]KAJ3985439.1 fatty acid hydroxylase [Lentinula detonsa]